MHWDLQARDLVAREDARPLLRVLLLGRVLHQVRREVAVLLVGLLGLVVVVQSEVAGAAAPLAFLFLGHPLSLLR